MKRAMSCEEEEEEEEEVEEEEEKGRIQRVTSARPWSYHM